MSPLTDQEKHLVSILEIVQVEKYVPKSAFNQWLGRKLEEREALARSFAAKLLYPTDDPCNKTIYTLLVKCNLL